VAWIRGGQADYIDLYAEAADRLDGEDGITVIEGPKVYIMRMIFNCADGPTVDANVRKALDMSMDRFDMIDKARFGAATLTGIIPSGFGEWALAEDELPGWFSTPDPESAKALLEEAGYGDGFSIGIKCSRPEHVALALVAQQNWEDVGIDAEVEQMEYGTYFQDFLDSNFEAIVVGQTYSPDPLDYLYPLFHTDGGGNRGKFSNPEIDAMLEEAMGITDREALKALLHEIQERIWVEGASQAFVYNALNFEGLRNRIQGYYPLYTARRTAFKQVWIDEA
jgi:peptide/nickel transport system substrate-binding protein